MALWLALGYPASIGPASYCRLRGRTPAPVASLLDVFYGPLDDSPYLQFGVRRYAAWWHRLAKRYEAASD